MVLAAGFLTMHGFFAVSAGADAHVPTTSVPAVSVEDAHASGHPAAGGPVLQVSTGAPSPSPHPADHHGLLAGCVVALVGVAVLALTHLLVRRRPLGAARLTRNVTRVVSWVGDHAPALPPPRIALCVVRV